MRMQFLRTGGGMAKGFRLSYLDELEVDKACRGGPGALVLDLLHVDSGVWTRGLRAIWSSSRVRLVGAGPPDPEADYVVRVVSVEPRAKGQRIS